MADKYIVHGAQYDGDGTSSDEATADGGVGAWNDIIVGVSGTPAYGTAQDDGDTVHIKSCDAAGDDIDITPAAKIIFKQGTTTGGSIRYIVDDGTIWVETGTITIQPIIDDNCFEITSVTDGYFYFDGKNRITLRAGWVSESNSSALLSTAGFSILKNTHFIHTVDGDSSSIRKRFLAASSYNPTIFTNCQFDKTVANGSYNTYIADISYGHGYIFNDCDFTTSTDNSDDAIFKCQSYGGSLFINGGSWKTKHADSKICYGYVTAEATITIINFDADPESVVLPIKTVLDSNSDANSCLRLVSSSMRNRGFGWTMAGLYGWSMYDGKGNYPYLNAVTPAGAGWAIRALPALANLDMPFDFVKAQVFYDLAPATKTITVHLAVRDNYAVPTHDKWWLQVQYVDDSGNDRLEVNIGGATALDTDTSTWSAENGDGDPYYGSQVFKKYKLDITTAYAVKQNTDIMITLIVADSAPDTNSFFLFDPSPEIA